MVFMKMPVGLNAVGDGVTKGKGRDRFFKDTDLNGWVKGEKNTVVDAEKSPERLEEVRRNMCHRGVGRRERQDGVCTYSEPHKC